MARLLPTHSRMLSPRTMTQMTIIPSQNWMISSFLPMRKGCGRSQFFFRWGRVGGGRVGGGRIKATSKVFSDSRASKPIQPNKKKTKSKANHTAMFSKSKVPYPEGIIRTLAALKDCQGSSLNEINDYMRSNSHAGCKFSRDVLRCEVSALVRKEVLEKKGTQQNSRYKLVSMRVYYFASAYHHWHFVVLLHRCLQNCLVIMPS